MALFWHRRDLRPVDNVGLAAAATETPAVPVFVLDDAVLAHASPNRVAFLLDSLADLRDAYRERGGDLLVRRGPHEGVLPALAEAHEVAAVHWNDDHSGLAQARDARVASALRDVGLDVAVHDDLLLQPPGSVLTKGGTPYQVFTPFYRTWRVHVEAGRGPSPVGEPTAIAGVTAATDSADDEGLPSLADLGFDPPEADVQPGGHQAASARLEAFCDGPIYDYAEDRDRPDRDNTSRLSAALRFGAVGIRTVWAATEAALDAAPDEAAMDGVEAFQRQLAWREFFVDKLAVEPSMVAANHQSFASPLAWRNDPDELAAWQAGETGYPFVDAGMRQLLAEGWLHNRARVVVASFLTKDLLVDWRHGYAWFREHLVDHDPANDAGGWQWAASTGWDPQPYFRVFNPTTQGERFDPEAAYVHRYVPELADVSADDVHDWPLLPAEQRRALAPDYPGPICDHAERREAAIAAFDRARYH